MRSAVSLATACVCALLSSVVLGGCMADVGGPPGGEETPDPREIPIEEWSPTAVEVERYLGHLAPVLVGRVLSIDERDRIATEGAAAIEPILEAWSTEDGFRRAARTMMEVKLSVSGTRDGIDFGLPGNIVEHIVRNDLPWSEVLTSESCYDAEGNAMECDTGAPFTAGVLGTRAYMVSRAGRFNLTRAGTMMHVFACTEYPINERVQPRVERGSLLPLFRADTLEEQMDARAAGGFGNGFECFACHGQFGPHAQPFVKFDIQGRWIADASGALNPDGQLGESFNGLMASHFVDPAEAASESAQMLGEPVDNLQGAAEVLARSRIYTECATKNVLNYGLALEHSAGIDALLVTEMADRAYERSDDPSYADLIVAAFGHPLVVRTTVLQLGPGTMDAGTTEETGR